SIRAHPLAVCKNPRILHAIWRRRVYLSQNGNTRYPGRAGRDRVVPTEVSIRLPLAAWRSGAKPQAAQNFEKQLRSSDHAAGFVAEANVGRGDRPLAELGFGRRDQGGGAGEDVPRV